MYDMTGRLVERLMQGTQSPGTYTVTVDAADWASGVYFYRLKAGSEQFVRRMLLLK